MNQTKYKNLPIPLDVHHALKMRAVQEKVSMIELIKRFLNL